MMKHERGVLGNMLGFKKNYLLASSFCKKVLLQFMTGLEKPFQSQLEINQRCKRDIFGLCSLGSHVTCLGILIFLGVIAIF